MNEMGDEGEVELEPLPFKLLRKPDRFEQIYRNELARRARGPSDKQWPSITLTLLRRQHAAYVRMVEDSAATFKDALKKLERYKKVRP